MIKIITNRCSQCSGIMFGQLSNTGDYYCKCSYAEIEKPSYTAQDMEAFAEWTSKSKWFYDDDGKWYQEEARWVDNEPVGFSTLQLRELWEQERRAK